MFVILYKKMLCHLYRQNQTYSYRGWIENILINTNVTNNLEDRMFINIIIYHHFDFLNNKSKYTFVWKINFKALISNQNKKLFLLDFTNLKVFKKKKYQVNLPLY